jgi:hypothetical protein
MSQDVLDSSTSSDRLVVTARIEGEPADQLACGEVEDANAVLGDEEPDRPSLVGAAYADVVEFESWRRVTVPLESTLSRRMRKWVRGRATLGRAFNRAL